MSLKALAMDYLDLYLVHWPVEKIRLETWDEMEELLEAGLTRSIGVSNYMSRHVEELLSHCSVPPAVNQIEFSPFLYQKVLLNQCRDAGIRLSAYSPLTKGTRLTDSTLTKIALAYSKTPAQVMIRWSLQHDLIVIPKSTSREHLVENLDVFDFQLAGEHMVMLDNLHENHHTGWDPSLVA